jgi:hypothetical protein
LTAIEQDVPEVPDRQVQLADGVPDLRGPRTVAHQPQRRFEREPRGEQPVHHDVVHTPGDAVTILHQAQGHLRPVACPPSRGSLVGRMRGSSGSGITAPPGTTAEVRIARAPGVLTGRDWPCHQGLERHGRLHTCSGLTQDYGYSIAKLRLAPCPG